MADPAPLVVGFVLGPMLEENLRRAMTLARGDATLLFVTSPISATLLLVSALLLAAAGDTARRLRHSPGDTAATPASADKPTH